MRRRGPSRPATNSCCELLPLPLPWLRVPATGQSRALLCSKSWGSRGFRCCPAASFFRSQAHTWKAAPCPTAHAHASFMHSSPTVPLWSGCRCCDVRAPHSADNGGCAHPRRGFACLPITLRAEGGTARCVPATVTWPGKTGTMLQAGNCSGMVTGISLGRAAAAAHSMTASSHACRVYLR